jgi:hypothetical protein
VTLRVGIADHFGWAVAVTASADHEVIDRRRVELIDPGVTPAPIHYESARLDVAATAALVADVRASVVRASSAALDGLYRRRQAVITRNANRGPHRSSLSALRASRGGATPYDPPPGRLRLTRSALASCDPRTHASAPSRIVFVEDRLVDVLGAECREGLGVDFCAWRSGRLKSSGTSAM